jgi:hypothetical protein
MKATPSGAGNHPYQKKYPTLSFATIKGIKLSANIANNLYTAS